MCFFFKGLKNIEVEFVDGGTFISFFILRHTTGCIPLKSMDELHKILN